MRIHANNNQVITAAGEEIDDVNDFIYLGGTVNIKGGTNEDIRRRLGHARIAWNKLIRAIWNNSQIERKPYDYSTPM